MRLQFISSKLILGPGFLSVTLIKADTITKGGLGKPTLLTTGQLTKRLAAGERFAIPPNSLRTMLAAPGNFTHVSPGIDLIVKFTCESLRRTERHGER